jgi:thioredoxin
MQVQAIAYKDLAFGGLDNMAVKKQFASFQEMIAESELPVLVDFYADWCHPCRLMAKELEKVQVQIGDRIQVVKIDTEKYEDIATDHHVYALPTLVLFKGGQPVQRFEGLVAADQLIGQLEPFL